MSTETTKEKAAPEVAEQQSVLVGQYQQALDILIQALKIATKAGTFEMDDVVIIGGAKNLMERLIDKK
jgi:hypothetical protein